jgi:putative colanic acid biosynthesis UDP-glucose lipid carrier transferase
MEQKYHQTIFDALSPYVFRGLDFILVFVAFAVAHEIRFKHINLSFEYQLLVIIASLLIVACVSSFGGYGSWRGRPRLEMLGRLLLAWLVASFILFAALAISKKGEDFSRLWIGYSFALSYFFSNILRFCFYAFMGFLRSRGFNQKRVLLIGQKENICDLQKKIREGDSAGFDVIEALDLELNSVADKEVRLSKESLEDFVYKNSVNEVWICLSLKNSELLDELWFALRHSTVNIRFVPDMSGFRLLNHKFSAVAGVSTINLSYSPLDGLNGILKRIEDLLIASVVFVLLLPLVLVIAILVRVNSPGPIIFKQLRLGADGRPINIYKFRSMYVHEDKDVKQAVEGDDRITPIGKFLRKTSLDELPQFYNVLQGRMSVVGPRPHAIAHNEHYKELVESYMQRHKVKPGITGWAQVNGLRGETDTIEKMEKRVECDLFYIDNWSLFFDIKIVVMTIFTVWFDKNAY